MFNVLETVVFIHNIPSAVLYKGDPGTVVEMLPLGTLEVEFVAASGRTQAFLMLKVSDVRHIGGRDIIFVRLLEKQATDLAEERTANDVTSSGVSVTAMVPLYTTND